MGDLAATATSSALGVSAATYDAGNGNGNGDDEFLALFQGGTNSVYKQRYIKIAQTFTGGAKKSPIIAFEANHDSDNHKSYGTIGLDSDGTFQFSNIADQSSAIAPGTEIPVTEKFRINGSGNVAIGGTSTSQKLTIHEGNLEFLTTAPTTQKSTIIFSESVIGDKSFFIEHDGSGAGAANLLKIHADGSGGTAGGITIQRDTKVGIGTDTPDDKLHVVGNVFVEDS